MSAWDTSNREALMSALEVILEAGMPGVKTVRRQSLERECLAEPELPAVLIDELSSSYTWEHRHCEQELRLVTVLVFDLQAMSKRSKAEPLGNVAKLREAMVAQFLTVLQNNPTLEVQLEGEDEPQPHVVDAFNGAEVRYMKTKYPTARALVTVRMLTSENFRNEVTSNWQQLILTAHASPDEGDDGLTTTLTLDQPTDGD